MSRPFPDAPFLRGNYAPWPMEGEIHDLVVAGELPARARRHALPQRAEPAVRAARRATTGSTATG